MLKEQRCGKTEQAVGTMNDKLEKNEKLQKIIIVYCLYESEWNLNVQRKLGISLQASNGQRLEWCMQESHAFKPWNLFQFLHENWQQ